MSLLSFLVSLVIYPSPGAIRCKLETLTDLQLADPTFGHPGRIDILLGVDVFTQVLLKAGGLDLLDRPPIAFETVFGWILAGSGASCCPATHVASHDSSFLSGDDLLQKVWETEESDW